MNTYFIVKTHKPYSIFRIFSSGKDIRIFEIYEGSGVFRKCEKEDIALLDDSFLSYNAIKEEDENIVLVYEREFDSFGN